MSDENTGTERQEHGEEQAEGNAPAPVPYDRFKEVNEKNKTLEARLKALEDERKTSEEQKAKEQGEYKSLYEQLQNELKAERLSNTKMKLASSKGLPVELVNRIQGETEDAIAEDIESLLSFIKEKQKGVPPPPKGGSNTNFDWANATPAQVREHLEKQKA